jgi:hypothetical protein
MDMVGKMKKKVKVIIRGDTQHLHKRYRWFCVNSQVLHSPSWWHANEWCLSHSFHVKDNLHKRSNNDHVHILYLSNSVSKSRITAKLTIKSQINRRCNRFRDYNTSVAIHQNSNFTVTVYFLSQTFVLWRQHIIFLFLLLIH